MYYWIRIMCLDISCYFITCLVRIASLSMFYHVYLMLSGLKSPLRCCILKCNAATKLVYAYMNVISAFLQQIAIATSIL
ncbi:hypothetical protein QVD17_32322 [Tagetes erecta]|uniref:Uncharacterized protein n=1 Tax=Tagetes erecta TaxID=13708 RepID=A0AAD8K8M6_TARER|nr:hypothetical protein QVD17_32322 [Tagetes erecta]